MRLLSEPVKEKIDDGKDGKPCNAYDAVEGKAVLDSRAYAPAVSLSEH